MKEAKTRQCVYEEYIKWEKNPKEGGNKPNRIICLYERAIADVPLSESLWVGFIDYIATTIKDADYILETCKRSVANCSWSIELWTTYLTQAETYCQSHEDIKGFFIYKYKLIILFIYNTGVRTILVDEN